MIRGLIFVNPLSIGSVSGLMEGTVERGNSRTSFGAVVKRLIVNIIGTTVIKLMKWFLALYVHGAVSKNDMQLVWRHWSVKVRLYVIFGGFTHPGNQTFVFVIVRRRNLRKGLNSSLDRRKEKRRKIEVCEQLYRNYNSFAISNIPLRFAA